MHRILLAFADDFRDDPVMPDSYSLRELDGQFYRRAVTIGPVTRLKPGIDPLRGNWTDDDWQTAEGEIKTWDPVATLAEADGVLFLCPKCFAAHSGDRGTHSVMCWFVGKVPDDADPKPGRWIPGGTSLDDLTFVGPAAASVLLTGGCGWHGFLRSGRATLR